MKFLFLSCLAVCWLPLAFVAGGDKQAANVSSQQGLYLFILSEPAGSYSYLGTVKVKSAMWSGVAPKMLELSVAQCKKEFPQANAIVFHNLEFNAGDAVQIK